MENTVEQVMQMCEGNTFVDMVEMWIAFVALIVSIGGLISQLVSQKKLIENNTRQNHFSALVELYRLGNQYTAGQNGFYEETNMLTALIEGNASRTDFERIYQSAECDLLRKAISYFDFLQKMIRDGSLTKPDCYEIVTFPLDLYKNMEPIVAYTKKQKIHTFDRFAEFCRSYLDYMEKTTFGG